MIAGELSSYSYAADVTAELRDGIRKQFQNLSGDITAVPSAASAVATTAAFSVVTTRLAQYGSEIQSVAIDAIDVFA